MTSTLCGTTLHYRDRAAAESEGPASLVDMSRHQMHQLELHLQQQHIQQQQQHHYQPFAHQQQHSQLQLQPQLQQHHSKLQQQQQALREQRISTSSSPLQQLQTAPPTATTTNTTTNATATTTTTLHQLQSQPQPQAIHYTQHYYPSSSADSQQQHLSSLARIPLPIAEQNNKLADNLYSSASQYQQQQYFAANLDPYCQTTHLTSAAHYQPTSSSLSSCNIYHHHHHQNNLCQTSNNNNNNSAPLYKPRNSAVYRHQYFQPFYATIQQNSNNYQLYQQRRQSHYSIDNTNPTNSSTQQQQQQQQTAASMSDNTTTTTTSATTTNNVVGKAGPRLIWLLFMHRHGDRTPLNMAPRDKYNNVMYWPEGFGNLDNAGRQRMYKLGKFIRRRYDDFLTDNIREVYSRSSDVDRCIESSHAVLAGLYPPSERFEWNKDLRWVPAPVHTVPAPEDYLLNEAGRKFLAEVVHEIRLIQQSDAVKELYADSVKERELMERELGYEYDMFWKFKATYSTLDIEERNGLEMPAWYTPELKEKLYRFAGIAFGLAGGGTEKLKKLRCGHLLNDIVSRMEMAPIEGPKMRDQSDFMQPTNAPTEVDDRRIVHYSTHDSIMAAFLEALSINSPMPVPPGFGATFFVELYVDLDEQGLPTSEKYIKLFYMDDTGSEKPIEKKLPNCKLNEKGQLTLNNFKTYIGYLLAGTNTCNL